MTAALDTAADVLLRLARREINGQLDDHSDSCLAGLIRAAAPALVAEPSDHIVLERFGELCEDVARIDGVRDQSIEWCQVVDDPREDAEQAAVGLLDDTLAKLTTPTGATA